MGKLRRMSEKARAKFVFSSCPPDTFSTRALQVKQALGMPVVALPWAKTASASASWRPTSSGRNKAMLAEAETFAKHVSKLHGQLSVWAQGMGEGFQTLQSILDAPLPRAFDEAPGTVTGPQASDPDPKGLRVGRNVAASQLPAAAAQMRQQLREGVMAPLQQWLKAYRVIKAHHKMTEGMRLDLDAHKRVAAKLQDQADRAALRPGVDAAVQESAQFKARTAADKTARLEQRYGESEVEVFNALVQLIRDAHLVQDLVVGSLCILQGLFSSSLAAFDMSQPEHMQKLPALASAEALTPPGLKTWSPSPSASSRPIRHLQLTNPTLVENTRRWRAACMAQHRGGKRGSRAEGLDEEEEVDEGEEMERNGREAVEGAEEEGEGEGASLTGYGAAAAGALAADDACMASLRLERGSTPGTGAAAMMHLSHDTVHYASPPLGPPSASSTPRQSSSRVNGRAGAAAVLAASMPAALAVDGDEGQGAGVGSDNPFGPLLPPPPFTPSLFGGTPTVAPPSSTHSAGTVRVLASIDSKGSTQGSVDSAQHAMGPAAGTGGSGRSGRVAAEMLLAHSRGTSPPPPLASASVTLPTGTTAAALAAAHSRDRGVLSTSTSVLHLPSSLASPAMAAAAPSSSSLGLSLSTHEQHQLGQGLPHRRVSASTPTLLLASQPPPSASSFATAAAAPFPVAPSASARASLAASSLTPIPSSSDGSFLLPIPAVELLGSKGPPPPSPTLPFGPGAAERGRGHRVAASWDFQASRAAAATTAAVSAGGAPPGAGVSEEDEADYNPFRATPEVRRCTSLDFGGNPFAPLTGGPSLAGGKQQQQVSLEMLRAGSSSSPPRGGRGEGEGAGEAETGSKGGETADDDYGSFDGYEPEVYGEGSVAGSAGSRSTSFGGNGAGASGGGGRASRTGSGPGFGLMGMGSGGSSSGAPGPLSPQGVVGNPFRSRMLSSRTRRTNPFA